jgi:hypothetical protein
MIDREGRIARGHAPVSNPREEQRAAGRERASKPPSRAAPAISRRQPAAEASCEPPPIEKGTDVLVPQGAVYDGSAAYLVRVTACVPGRLPGTPSSLRPFASRRAP